MKGDGDQPAEKIDAALARLLDAITDEPVPPRIRTLADELRAALRDKAARRTG